eukprot:m.307592 g.307592  ORF g.307592 m.307592 type:complete len:710 (+) comp16463_c1_seq3:122-2251(+)
MMMKGLNIIVCTFLLHLSAEANTRVSYTPSCSEYSCSLSDTSTVEFKLHEPIVCANSSSQGCVVIISVEAEKREGLSSSPTITPCVLIWDASEWKTTKNITLSNTQSSSIRFRVKALSPDPKYDDYESTLYVGAAISPGRCQITGGHHVRTYDGATYSTFMVNRGFNIHRSLTEDIVVEGKTSTASHGYLCYIAVRNGPNMISVDKCGSSVVIKQESPSQLPEHQISVNFFNSIFTSTYTVNIPSGDWFRVVPESGTTPRASFYSSSMDYKNVVGLCGNFNGDGSDDYRQQAAYNPTQVFQNQLVSLSCSDEQLESPMNIPKHLSPCSIWQYFDSHVVPVSTKALHSCENDLPIRKLNREQFSAILADNSKVNEIVSLTPAWPDIWTRMYSPRYSLVEPPGFHGVFSLDLASAKLVVNNNSKLRACAPLHNSETCLENPQCAWQQFDSGAYKCVLKPVNLTVNIAPPHECYGLSEEAACKSVVGCQYTFSQENDASYCEPNNMKLLGTTTITITFEYKEPVYGLKDDLYMMSNFITEALEEARLGTSEMLNETAQELGDIRHELDQIQKNVKLDLMEIRQKLNQTNENTESGLSEIKGQIGAIKSQVKGFTDNLEEALTFAFSLADTVTDITTFNITELEAESAMLKKQNLVLQEENRKLKESVAKLQNDDMNTEAELASLKSNLNEMLTLIQDLKKPCVCEEKHGCRP